MARARRRIVAGLLLAGLAAGGSGCGRETAQAPTPSILLVTLDTTRADSIGPEAMGITTPAFNALAARGRRFRQAYATVPETLPSHASMLTGLYPAGHGIHENGRRLPDGTPVLAERLRGAGYRTAAFVSSFVLAKRFGLARGFDVYDDALPAGRRGIARQGRTDAALAALGGQADAPLFLWVHYFDPHYPVRAARAVQSAHPEQPYLGEVASMDAELGRLVQAFERTRRGRSPSSSSAITARDWAITASRCTATCCTSRPCTCRS